MTMDLYQWGNVKFNDNFSKCNLTIDNLNYSFVLSKDSYTCYVMTVNDNLIINFKDTLISSDVSHFKREIFSKSIIL